jgi:hypothetical protein
MFIKTSKPSWAVRAAKLLSRDCAVVLIRFNDDCENVELVHDSRITGRNLIEAAQMALAKVLTQVK